MSKLEVLLSEEQIQQKVSELAATISQTYGQRTVHVVALLENGFMFMPDLVRQLTCPVVCQFVKVEMSDVMEQGARAPRGRAHAQAGSARPGPAFGGLRAAHRHHPGSPGPAVPGQGGRLGEDGRAGGQDRRAARGPGPPILPGSRCRAASWSGMGWATGSSTATCPTSGR